MTDQGKPDSVIKHEKFEDLMERYWGQMDNALYAAEQACPYSKQLSESHNLGFKTFRVLSRCNCPFIRDHNFCGLMSLRDNLGDHVPQHDIQIPEDDTQAQRKANR